MSTIADLKTFLLKLRSDLNILEERQAKLGGNTPLELINQIDDHKTAIALTEQAIAGELSEAKWWEALERIHSEFVGERPQRLANVFAETSLWSGSQQVGGVNLSEIEGKISIEGGIDASVKAGGDVVGGDKKITYNQQGQLVETQYNVAGDTHIHYHGSPPEPDVPEKRPQSFEPETVLVAAGPFLMGSDEGQARQAPQHQVDLPAYEIGIYPVTNKKYAPFIKNVRTQDEPAGWFLRRPPKGKEDHPVVGVSWHDAWAYCRWLSQKTGRTYRLPSEAEWEKAARGVEGQRYLWGEDWAADRCNAGRDDTSPVKEPANQDRPYFPRGKSPFGCYDMVGNVEEWTSTLWGSDPGQSDFEYPYNPDDGREDLEADRHLPWVFRIHRGGSFQDSHPDLSCAARSFDNPNSKLDWRGFRVVREL